ncbi:hypothetical protein FK521_30410, partial [Klebsiella pneumoniae]|nr:hypothetical protein [Klebsiella pneumoniae]
MIADGFGVSRADANVNQGDPFDSGVTFRVWAPTAQQVELV